MLIPENRFLDPTRRFTDAAALWPVVKFKMLPLTQKKHVGPMVRSCAKFSVKYVCQKVKKNYKTDHCLAWKKNNLKWRVWTPAT